MAEKSEAGSSGYRPWWAESKERVAGMFPIVRSLAGIRDINDGTLLPPWTPADVDQFAKEDPVHGEQVVKARAVAQAATFGAAVGGLAAAGYCLRQTKSPAGAFLVLVIGTAASWALTEEVASAAYGLDSVSPVQANIRFLEWWKSRQQ